MSQVKIHEGQEYTRRKKERYLKIKALMYLIGGRHGIGWESKGPGFEPQQLQATFDPVFPKK